MKNKILVMLLVLVMACLSLFACNGDGGQGGNGGEGENNYDDFVFGGDIIPTMIIDNNIKRETVNAFYESIKGAVGTNPEYAYTSDKDELPEDKGHEIILGKADRPASTKAYRKLRTIQRSSDDTIAFLFYASGSSVAIAYDEDYDDLALMKAIETFTSKYLTDKTELELTSGVVYQETFSVYDYYRQVDKEYYEQAWSKLAEAVGGETGLAIANAFQEMYSIYNHDVVTWFANLYDPAVGGFYYSNSARDNGSYAPDTESTSQALGFVGNLGKVRAWRTGQSAGYANTLSEKTKNEIGVYIKSLQDENGFFYNYQWDKADTDARLSRRARDLSWCTSMLQNLGLKPTYDTPNGVKGDGVVVEGTYDKTILMQGPGRVGTSTAVAVSKVVLAAHAPEFESVETLEAYLDSLYKGVGNFYSIGNTMTSQMTQINTRDKELKDKYYKDHGNYDGYVSLKSVVIDFFNKNQDPDTGLWGHGAKQPANYLGVNGLLKISGVYSSAGAEIPYAEKAAKAAIDAITSDEVMGAVVDLYNTWFSVSNILSNLKNYGTTQTIDGVEMTGAERANKIMVDLREIAAPAIIKSGVKISDFEKEDGSYSYTKASSSSTSQGMPVAIPGTNEGDVNATVIATNGLVGNIYNALGLSMVAIYGEYDFRVFMDIFNDLGPVIKHTPLKVLGDEPVTFDDATDGDEVCDLGGGMPEGGFLVKKDTRTGAKGNVVQVYSNATTAGGTVSARNNAATKSGECYIFEADMCVNSNTSDGYFMQITMGSSYMFSLKKGSGKVTVFESTTASSSTARYIDIASIDIGKWFNLRVEYYVNGLNGQQRACIYIDGKLLAVTDGFYGAIKEGTNGITGTPVKASLSETKMYKMMSCKLDMLLDNVYCTSTKDTYKVPADKQGLVYDVDKDVAPTTTPTTPEA